MANDRFRGSSTHTLDSKGRVSIPAKDRAVMAVRGVDSLVLVPWEGHLRAYPEEEWCKYEDRMMEEASRQGMGDAFRYLTSFAETNSLDKQGRILIPPKHRALLKFEKEVMIVGSVHWLELWDPQRYDEIMAQTLKDFGKYTAELSQIGLL